MLGLIKKDFLMIKANLKATAIIYIIFLIMIFQGTLDSVFIIPLIGIMLFISTFSYDDFNNWNAFAVALPNGRKNVVKAKYIASLILTVVLSIISIASSTLISYTRNNNIDILEIISGLMGTLLSCIIIISLLYPIIFKFGSTNGRIILFVVIFAFAGIISIVSNYIDMSSFVNLINMLDKYWYIGIPLIAVIFLGISYLISNKIYKNKEF